jgi:hypothetical protein
MTNGRRHHRGGLASSFGATSDNFAEVLLNIQSASSQARRLGVRQTCGGLNRNYTAVPAYLKKGDGIGAVQSKNERVELEMRILRYRQIARRFAHDPQTYERIQTLVRELEDKLREIDE